MTSVRIRTCAAGAAVAVVAGALVDHGAVFGSDFPRTALLGVLVGAIVALVPHRRPAERLTAAALGLGAAWLGYLVRAGLLPDIPLGRAIAAVLVVSLVTAVATATADRLPLWAGLLGAGALVGGYEAGYVASPGDVGAASLTAVTSLVLAAVAGHVAAGLLFATRALAPAVPAAASASDAVADSAAASASRAVPGPRVATDVPTPSEPTR